MTSVRVDSSGVYLNDVQILAAQSVDVFHQLLGQPTRLLPAGPPAPYGHRNSYVHYYDKQGVTLLEHHYTHQISSISFVFDINHAIHPTLHCCPGLLDLGGLQLRPGDSESILSDCEFRFTRWLPGTHSVTVSPKIKALHPIFLSVNTLVSGEDIPDIDTDCKIVSAAICLYHDPWDTTHRPK